MDNNGINLKPKLETRRELFISEVTLECTGPVFRGTHGTLVTTPLGIVIRPNVRVSSALQTLHKVSAKAREQNYFQGGISHSWVDYYENRIESDRSCLNEWHTMDNLESRRPASPDSIRLKPTQREETERVIQVP
ncbi:hypothetical protein NQ317_007500 [Molorchus minor]|uniref:Slingshot N-terminal domain-containing protein n=1 Tax=Molorchus minor TaxID=1323400 RepID=A0ABQ9ISH1_9CUCU|nr:hypothetical protein NQ317_007500 [Molorchus minor]